MGETLPWYRCREYIWAVVSAFVINSGIALIADSRTFDDAYALRIVGIVLLLLSAPIYVMSAFALYLRQFYKQERVSHFLSRWESFAMCAAMATILLALTVAFVIAGELLHGKQQFALLVASVGTGAWGTVLILICGLVKIHKSFAGGVHKAPDMAPMESA